MIRKGCIVIDRASGERGQVTYVWRTSPYVDVLFDGYREIETVDIVQLELA